MIAETAAQLIQGVCVGIDTDNFGVVAVEATQKWTKEGSLPD